MDTRVLLENGTNDPTWVDKGWLDTVVTVGLTCFVLCLMKLSKVRTGGRRLYNF
jgi:hypothetical protein